MEKAILIEKIICIEYDFFVTTKSVGGPAPCQSQTKTFILARSAYWRLFPVQILESYYEDLKQALIEKENLVTLKYAYMMKNTFPEEYEAIKERIPYISDEKRRVVESIVSINMFWEEEIKDNYPEQKNRNRPLYSKEDKKNNVSIETYLRGELLTYSEKTLKLILFYYVECFTKKINLVYKNIKYLMREKNSAVYTQH